MQYNMQYDDAKKAFRQAQSLDITLARAYWGEAMSENHPLWVEPNLKEGRTIFKDTLCYRDQHNFCLRPQKFPKNPGR
ncbi:MAG: hypothetical protein NPIRA01_10160 [Nitrospirales bacterium]|nr:MAG: hypothetical protein NPIRA01_10160 [Nitrospirales bacterium]